MAGPLRPPGAFVNVAKAAKSQWVNFTDLIQVARLSSMAEAERRWPKPLGPGARGELRALIAGSKQRGWVLRSSIDRRLMPLFQRHKLVKMAGRGEKPSSDRFEVTAKGVKWSTMKEPPLMSERAELGAAGRALLKKLPMPKYQWKKLDQGLIRSLTGGIKPLAVIGSLDKELARTVHGGKALGGTYAVESLDEACERALAEGFVKKHGNKWCVHNEPTGLVVKTKDGPRCYETREEALQTWYRLDCKYTRRHCDQIKGSASEELARALV